MGGKHKKYEEKNENDRKIEKKVNDDNEDEEERKA